LCTFIVTQILSLELEVIDLFQVKTKTQNVIPNCMLFAEEKLLIKELHTTTRISESVYLTALKRLGKQLTLNLSFRDENSTFHFIRMRVCTLQL